MPISWNEIKYDDTPKNRTVSLIDKFTANDKEKI
jgi:hypothetical protein